MNDRPVVSVVLPVFNEASRLPDCLDSLLAQTYHDYEVLIVNNGSTDKTAEIIERYKKKSSRVVSVFEPEISCGSARNTGEKLCRGKIVLMTDADCRVPADWITQMIAPIETGECAAVQGGEQSHQNHFIGRVIEGKSDLKYGTISVLKDKDILGYIDTKNFAILRASLAAVGYSPRGYASNDTALAIALSRTNLIVRVKNSVKVRHLHSSSFGDLARKQFSRAFWLRHATKQHYAYLTGSSFLKNTNQAVSSFFSFFPGLAATLFKKGAAYFFYDLVEGVSWRTGLLAGALSAPASNSANTRLGSVTSQ